MGLLARVQRSSPPFEVHLVWSTRARGTFPQAPGFSRGVVDSWHPVPGTTACLRSVEMWLPSLAAATGSESLGTTLIERRRKSMVPSGPTGSPLGRGRPGRPQVVAASVIVMLATRRCGVLYTYRRQVQELQIHLWPLPAGTGAGFLSLSGLHPSTLLIATPVGSCRRAPTTSARAREPFRCARTRAGPHRRRLGSPGAAPRSSRGCCCAALARRPSAAAGRRERRRRP